VYFAVGESAFELIPFMKNTPFEFNNWYSKVDGGPYRCVVADTDPVRRSCRWSWQPRLLSLRAFVAERYVQSRPETPGQRSLHRYGWLASLLKSVTCGRGTQVVNGRCAVFDAPCSAHVYKSILVLLGESVRCCGR
jgi:hypothetical protein